MSQGEDPFGKQYDDTAVSHLDYELEKIDKDSLIEIRRMLVGKEYKDAQKVREHLEYVENLIQKINKIILQERQLGVSNLSLERDFLKIKQLYAELTAHLDTLEGF